MSLDPGTFETIVPSRFMTFAFPKPFTSLSQPLFRIAVLDSPAATDPPRVAAMLVPPNRESDWTFSTEAGHLQILLSTSPKLSRLILVGDLPTSPHPTAYDRLTSNPCDSVHREEIELKLTPLLIALSPKSSFQNGFPEIPFLSYDDDVIRSVVVERCVGSCAGEMLIEDVELEVNDELDQCNIEFWRRLRFKRMPNLIQTQMRVLPKKSNGINGCVECEKLGDVELKVDVGVLVHPYLTPMVAGLSLISSYIDQQSRFRSRPKALCLGVGGGALLSFLNTQLGFQVVGVEADEVVLRVAKQYFGLEDGELVRLCVGDGIELMERLSRQEKKRNVDSLDVHSVKDTVDVFDAKFDVIMVDLDSSDVRMGGSAPPLEFVRKSVLLAARLILCDHGILVVNVIPPNRSFYDILVSKFQEVFQELYEIDVGNGENFVLIATASMTGIGSIDCGNSFFMKLELVISGAYMDSLRKI